MTIQREPVADLGFGRHFTDHMAAARYERVSGWSEVQIVEHADLSVSPAAMSFHYGQSIFEGLKAYHQPDDSIALFRPFDNAARFNDSARRLAMPEFPETAFVDACVELVRCDVDAVPAGAGESLYLRPVMMATEPALGVRPADEYLFYVIASPVGAYFPSGVEPIDVWVTREFVRAAPGGTGAAKCAGNYAASLVAKAQASRRGCGEALWLDAVDRRWIEELGGMNICFIEGGHTLVTPPAGDTILNGVTRRSLLELAASLGYGVDERRIAIDEIGGGRYTEAFACGTAAVVVPIRTFRSDDGDVRVGDGSPGAVTMSLREQLVRIQEGRAADPFGWRMTVGTAPPR